ncbi:hypothetical protein QYE76_000359 [Lolium multiflorum]|uniref:Transposase MuDR plant domain-containing protein n=1 Tax=Lolium multiflorum TaxID=4521 RepID=A0AAD8VXL2_LOLMU|nr:hypothetical protein QYE76_000359 [Lolium multiflorum]
MDVQDVECVLGRTRQSSRKRTISEPVSEVSGEDKDSDGENDSDFDCVDSDYEVSKGDDDLYADNVDGESDDDQVQSLSLKGKFASAKGKVQSSGVKVQSCAPKDKEQAKTEIKDDESDEENLWAPDSDNETTQLRFKFFREADLTNPKFYVGQVFSSVELLRKAVRTYSCIHRKDIKFPVNDKKRVNAKCVQPNGKTSFSGMTPRVSAADPLCSLGKDVVSVVLRRRELHDAADLHGISLMLDGLISIL